jgi:hypothetical protein
MFLPIYPPHLHVADAIVSVIDRRGSLSFIILDALMWRDVVSGQLTAFRPTLALLCD